MSGKVAKRRLGRACALVVLCVAAVLVACAATDKGIAQGGRGGGPLVGSLWKSIEAGSDVDSALEKEGFVRLTKENAPRWLEGELLGLDEMGQAIANQAFDLIWFVREGSAEDAAAFLEAELTAKGWRQGGEEDGFGAVDGDGDGEAVQTFVKQEGECSWVMAECAQAGAEAVTVLHIRHI